MLVLVQNAPLSATRGDSSLAHKAGEDLQGQPKQQRGVKPATPAWP